VKFESTGWSRIDIGMASLDRVEEEIGKLGVAVRDFDVAQFAEKFKVHIDSPEYAGDYRTYGGAEWHCFLEKALEHFLSFELANPRPGGVGIDVGSCQSVAPAIARRLFGATVYEQDLAYPPGVNEHRIGSSAAAIPLPDKSVDFMMLHCTFEHFEGGADTGFIMECARLLKPGGKVVILPLYLNARHCNITGEADAEVRAAIGFDSDAQFHCVIPEWHNRFGRHYSPSALSNRVLAPALAAGLRPRLLRCRGWEKFDDKLWLRWIMILEKTSHQLSEHTLSVAPAEIALFRSSGRHTQRHST
jgi:hypothetical protein